MHVQIWGINPGDICTYISSYVYEESLTLYVGLVPTHLLPITSIPQNFQNTIVIIPFRHIHADTSVSGPTKTVKAYLYPIRKLAKLPIYDSGPLHNWYKYSTPLYFMGLQL